MKLLFLDRHYPGHFPATARWFASQPEHEVVFLSDFRRKNYNEPGIFHGIVRLPSKLPQGTSAKHVLGMSNLRANAYAGAMRKLKDKGFIPDYICHGAASCCALYAKDIYPDVPQLGIFDWYHQAPGQEEQGYTADVPSEEAFGGLRVHNLFQLTMLEACNVLCTPSAWQRDSYPTKWRDRMHVLHPGIDTDFFAPEANNTHHDALSVDEQPPNGKYITFLERRLSPASGFGNFYRLLPQLFLQDTNCQVILSGSATAGKDGSKPYMEHILRSHTVDPNRLHHKLFRTAEEYRCALRASTVHVHMPSSTIPPDRGLLEAMSCGCLVVATETPPLSNILQHKHNALLVPPRCSKNMIKMLMVALQDRMPHIRQQARNDIIDNYDSKIHIQNFLQLVTAP